MKNYPRLIEKVLKIALKDTPVVCLLGPRQSGKTTLVQKLKPKITYISFDDTNLLTSAKNDPLGFVGGLPDPVILDEVQRAPEIIPAIKAIVDKERKPGRFLLTGSANLLLLPRVQESLAGRMEVVQMNPLSELEKHRGKMILLQAMMMNKIRIVIEPEKKTVNSIPVAICGGGYPEPLSRNPTRARQWYRQYLNAIVQRDARDIAGIRQGDDLLRLIELLAYRTANLLNITNLANELDIDRATVEKYVSVLERLFLIRRLPAWHRNSAKRLVKSPKVHIIDSGLASVLNRLTVNDWQKQSSAFGGLLESFVIQQMICQATWINPDLRFSHYRDKDQVEVDLVIENGRKVWGIEVKRSATTQARDGAGLSRIAAQSGKDFQGGILLYSGSSCLSLKVDNCFAVPIDWLWKK